MPGGSRAAVGPVNDKRLAELIEPVIAAAGLDLESVRMSVAGKRRLLRIVVDGDQGVSLDDAADVSREISAMLREGTVEGRILPADADGVTLELAKGERRFELGELGAGAIQIEFGRIPEAELDESEDEDPDLADEEDGNDDDEDLGAGGDGH